MMIELVATLFRYTVDYIMHRMTFAQALTMIEMHNDREEKAHEEAERRSKNTKGRYDRSDSFDPEDPETWPYVDEVIGAFQGAFG